jgi:hypothetical protein
MGRFKSTENILSGIVGKDDQGLGKISVAFSVLFLGGT